MRSASAGSCEHFIPIKRKQLLVSRRPPRKRINPIKAEHVVDAKEVKRTLHAAHALPPPFEIISAHRLPSIKRNAPVLSPFLGKLVVLEIRLRWRAAAPIEHELVRSCKNVGAVITDTKRNVAHDGDPALRGIRFELAPLLLRDPLHVAKETLARRERCLSILRQIAQPEARFFDRAVIRSPFVPRLGVAVFLHQRAKE